MQNNRVVITGIGVISPVGNTIDEFSRALREGRSGIRHLPELVERGFRCTIGGVPQGVDELVKKRFEESDYLDMDSVARYGCLAALDAWEDAGFEIPDRSSEPNWDAGAIIGSESIGLGYVVDKMMPFVAAKKIRRLGSRYIEQTMMSGVAARTGGYLGLGNRVSGMNTASSTGIIALVEAYRHIKHGYAKVMLAGASESSHPYAWSGVDSLRVLACKYNAEPEKASRPMSASAAGFVPAAGAGVVVLEDLKHARDRKAHIYAEVSGASINSGGQRNGGTMTAPNPEGIQRCIQEALDEAGIYRAATIDLINGHLTGTFADPWEIRNWHEALGLDDPKNMPTIHATKSIVGHSMVASNAIENVACMIMLRDGFIHPSINCEDVHPEIEAYADSIPHEVIEAPAMTTIVKAGLGFGDTNGCAVFEKMN